jgi:hypothetical protein
MRQGFAILFRVNHPPILLGTSSFTAAGWQGSFYPKRMRPADCLAFYADADKTGYVDYLNKILPLVRPGGLILAHNVDMVPDYVKVVTTNPNLETIFYMEGGGLGVNLKKR